MSSTRASRLQEATAGWFASAGGLLLLLAAACAPEQVDEPEPRVARQVSLLRGALPAPSMAYARSRHSATLLPQGTVLVAGGELSGARTTAEIYDPFANTWTPTGTHAGHVWHGAALLPTGRVIVIDINSVGTEIYDPASGTWADVPDPPTGVNVVSPVLLNDGRLLVPGGYTGITGEIETSAVSLLDPLSLMFTVAAPMMQARQLVPTVVLRDGRVIVIGGYRGGGYVPGVELYEPTANRWVPAAPLDSPIGYTNAFLLPSGKVLAFAGIGSRRSQLYDPATDAWTEGGLMSAVAEKSASVLLPSGIVLSIGGAPQGRGVQLYDPATGAWTAAPALETARDDHTATLLPNGRVLIAGGTGVSSAELYDPQNPGWTRANGLLQARSHVAATLLPLDGDVLVVGGHDGKAPLATVERFDAESATWSTAAPMATPRTAHRASVLFNGRVLVTGGFSSEGQPLSSVELYDPGSNTWSSMRPMGHARSAHTATLLPSGEVLVSGGADAANGSVELYDPATDTWTSLPPMSTGRRGHSATLLPSGRLLVIGGGTSSAELYDLSTSRWSFVAPIPEAVRSHSATLLTNGEVFVALDGTQRAYTWSPATDAWTQVPALPRVLDEHSAILLRNGDVMLTGNPNDTVLHADLYHAGSGTWRSVALTGAGRGTFATVMLRNGRVLAVGGRSATGPLASVDVFDEGRGARPEWTPSLTRLSTSGLRQLSLEGALFTGTHAGGGGKYSSSRTNFPVLMVRNLESGWTRALPTRGWTATAALAEVPATLPQGNYLAHVVVNGTDGPGVVWTHAPAVHQLVFETPPRTFEVSRCPGDAGHIRVALQDAEGSPVTASAGGQPFTAASTSTGEVTWYRDAACTDVAVGGQFTIPAGASGVDLYYVDAAPGAPVISVSNASGLTNPPHQRHRVEGPASVGGAPSGCGCATTLPGGLLTGLLLLLVGVRNVQDRSNPFRRCGRRTRALHR